MERFEDWLVQTEQQVEWTCRVRECDHKMSHFNFISGGNMPFQVMYDTFQDPLGAGVSLI